MTLGEYLTYNSDENRDELFTNLYSQLEIIHNNGLAVDQIDTDHITYNDKYSTFEFGDDFRIASEEDIDDNIMALTKIFFGTFVESPNGFRDYSKVSTDWIKDSFPELCDRIQDDGFKKDFFERVLNGERVYYNRYKEMDGDMPPILKKALRRTPSREERAFVYKQLIPAILISLLAIVLVTTSIIMK